MFLYRKKMILTYFFATLLVAIVFSFNFLAITKTKIDASLPGLEKIVDGSINVTAIFLGFIVAALSILLSAKDSYLLNAIMKGEKKVELQSDFKFSIFIGLILIVFSFLMYPLIQKELYPVLTFENKFFYVWLFILLTFLIHILRFNLLLIELLFNLYEIPTSRQLPDETISPEHRQSVIDKVARASKQNQ